MGEKNENVKNVKVKNVKVKNVKVKNEQHGGSSPCRRIMAFLGLIGTIFSIIRAFIYFGSRRG